MFTVTSSHVFIWTPYYSSPPLTRTPLLPKNSLLNRKVSCGEREHNMYSWHLLAGNSVLSRGVLSKECPLSKGWLYSRYLVATEYQHRLYTLPWSVVHQKISNSARLSCKFTTVFSYFVCQVLLRYFNDVHLWAVAVSLECHLILWELLEDEQQQFVVVALEGEVSRERLKEMAGGSLNSTDKLDDF